MARVAVLLLALVCVTVAYAGAVVPLRFRADGTFKIVQFTDTHFGAFPEIYSNLAVYVIKAVLQAEKPDLVMLTGDIIAGGNWYRFPILKRKGWYKGLYDKMTAPMIEMGIPWAVALGNHDDQGEWSKDQILAYDMTHNLSYTQHGPAGLHYASNYVVDILSHNGDVPAAQIVAIDTGDDGKMFPDIVEWYKSVAQSSQQRYQRIVPALSFMHIPMPELLEMYNTLPTNGTFAEGEVDCWDGPNPGLFQAYRDMGSVKGVFFGHDHKSDFVGDYQGIVLGYGRKTGYGAYGPPKGVKRGARVYELFESQQPAPFRTWIRQQDGSLESAQATHPPPDPAHRIPGCGKKQPNEDEMVLDGSEVELLKQFA